MRINLVLSTSVNMEIKHGGNRLNRILVSMKGSLFVPLFLMAQFHLCKVLSGAAFRGHDSF